jgi:polar amino acid transport system substrate-binding protein
VKRPVLLLAAAAWCACGVHAQTIHAVTELASRTVVVDGKVSGPLTEAAEASLKAAGLGDYRVSVYPWARAYQVALREPNTLIYPIARTPAREGQFKWVGEIQKIHYHFVKLVARKDIVIRRLDDARPYSIGVIRDDVRHQYLQAHGFARLLPGAKWSDNMAHLMNGQIDLLILADTDLSSICSALALKCDAFAQSAPVEELTSSMYLAFSPSTPDVLVERTRVAFERLKAAGKIDRILNAKP